jgi:hypothetical protein
MTFHKTIQFLAVSFLLSACNSDFKVDVFSSDFFLTDNVKTPAEMAVEIPSCTSERLEKYKTEIISMFSNDSNAKVVGCERRDMDSMLIVSLDAEIASETSRSDVVLFRESFPDLTHENKNYEVRGVSPMLNANFIQRVKSMMNNNMQSLTYDKVSLAVTLNNDGREDLLVTGYNLWVNGEPKERFRREMLPRRQKLDLRFSNIISDLVIRGNKPTIFFIGKQK